ncbi:hypothetical protein BV20DRAFT_972515 [Pilatotrama ljubarskyi]|nr:hypothetical protein BV20DRAFT_972515 [Pilatotrama ljubarskyi]
MQNGRKRKNPRGQDDASAVASFKKTKKASAAELGEAAKTPQSRRLGENGFDLVRVWLERNLPAPAGPSQAEDFAALCATKWRSLSQDVQDTLDRVVIELQDDEDEAESSREGIQVNVGTTRSKRKAAEDTPGSRKSSKKKRQCSSGSAEKLDSGRNGDGQMLVWPLDTPLPRGTSSFRASFAAPMPTYFATAGFERHQLEAAQRRALKESISSPLHQVHRELVSRQNRRYRDPAQGRSDVVPGLSQASPPKSTPRPRADLPGVIVSTGQASLWPSATWMQDAPQSLLPYVAPSDDEAPAPVASTSSDRGTMSAGSSLIQEDTLLSDATWEILNDPDQASLIPDEVLASIYHELQSAMVTDSDLPPDWGAAAPIKDGDGEWFDLQLEGLLPPPPFSSSATRPDAGESDGQAVTSPGRCGATTHLDDLEQLWDKDDSVESVDSGTTHQSNSLFTPTASPASSTSSVEVPLANRDP